MRLALILLLMLPALAGCFGHGEDAAGRGDIVLFRADAFVAGTDIRLLDSNDGPYDIRVGGGLLGLSFDRRLVGAEPGDTLRFTTEPSVDANYGSPVTAGLRLADQPATGQEDLRTWLARAGEPVPGDVVEHEAWPFPRLVLQVRANTTQATVERINETTLERHVQGMVVVRTLDEDSGTITEREEPVDYVEQTGLGYADLEPGNTTMDPPSTLGSVVFRHKVPEGHRVGSAVHGGDLVHTYNPTTDAVERRVDPIPGVVFQASTPNEFGLTPGLYRVESSGEDEMTVRPVLQPQGTIAIFLTQAVEWEVQVVDTREAPADAEPLPGHEGTGLSPVLGRD